ncbi:MAG: DUF502 domain-containing protein [Bacillota bacterium]
MRRIRTFFVTGLIILIPVAITVFFLRFLFTMADGFLRPLVGRMLGRDYPGLGVLVTLALVLATGAVATNYLGSRIIRGAEAIILHTPFVRGVYTTAKQIVEAFVNAANTPFRRVVLIEYPRRGLYTLAFVTSDSRGEVQDKTNEEVVNVFVPTTPNPTSGFFIMVPRSQLIRLDMTVDEGLKLVVSGGMIAPANSKALASSPKEEEIGS